MLGICPAVGMVEAVQQDPSWVSNLLAHSHITGLTRVSKRNFIHQSKHGTTTDFPFRRTPLNWEKLRQGKMGMLIPPIPPSPWAQ